MLKLLNILLGTLLITKTKNRLIANSIGPFHFITIYSISFLVPFLRLMAPLTGEDPDGDSSQHTGYYTEH